MLSISNYAYSTPPASHGCYDCPLITLSVVHFGCEQTLVSVKTATYVDLCGERRKVTEIVTTGE